MMVRTNLENTEEYALYRIHGQTRFQGCQCIKDCTCHDDFISEFVDFYYVKKKIGRRKNTTKHSDLISARERINQITTPV